MGGNHSSIHTARRIAYKRMRVLNKLKEVSQSEKAINTLVRKVNKEEEEKLSPLKQKEKKLLKEIKEVENKICNFINFLSEGEGKNFLI